MQDCGQWNADGSWTCRLCGETYRGYAFVQNHREWHILTSKIPPPTMKQLLARDEPKERKVDDDK